MAEPISRRGFLKAAILSPLIPSLLTACRRADDKRVVNFFNWSNYIGSDTLPEFTKRTGVEVRYDLFADEDEMFTKLRAGARGYDLIVVGRLSDTALPLAQPHRAGPGKDAEESRQPRPAIPAPVLRSGRDDGSLSVGHDRHRLQQEEA